MERKFELHLGDVLKIYVKPKPEGDPIDTFPVKVREVRGGMVSLVEISGRSTSHYDFKVSSVERGRIGYFEFEPVSPMDEILREDPHAWLE